MNRLLAAVLTGAILLSTFTACSGSSAGSAAGTAAVTATNASNNINQSDKTLIVGLQGDPLSFNQDAAPDDCGYTVAENLFSRLVKINNNNEIIPDLAKSWDVSKDAKTYTFHLNSNVKWHDGQAFSSDDVKWTYDTIVSKKGYLSSYLQNLDKITCPDANTVVFHMKEPDATLLSSVSYIGSFILPKHIYQDTDWTTAPAATQKPVGTGPFKFSEYQKGVSVKMDANSDYFSGAPKIGHLAYTIIPDANTAIQAFNNGELDVLGVIPPPAQVGTLMKTSGTKVVKSNTFGRYYFGFNMRQAPFNKKEIRQAVAMAVNRDEIISKAFMESGKLAEGFYTPTIPWAFNKDSKIPSYDVAAAKKLMENSGLTKDKDGNYLTITFAVLNVDPFPNIASIIQANLKEIGIKVQINTVDVSVYTQMVTSGKGYDLFAAGGALGPDPSNLSHRIVTGGMLNLSGYSNPEIDKLFAKGAVTMDQTARGEIYKNIQKIAADDLPYISLSEVISIDAYKDYLSGMPYDESMQKASYNEMTYVTFNKDVNQ